MLWRDKCSKTSIVWQLCNSLVAGQYSGYNQVLFKYSYYLHIVPSQSSWNKRKDARISRSKSIHHHHLNDVTIIIICTFKFCIVYRHGVCSGKFLVSTVTAVLRNFLHFKLTWGWGSRHFVCISARRTAPRTDHPRSRVGSWSCHSWWWIW